MANTIRIKRRAAGGAAGAPSSLFSGELAYNEQDLTLYIGEGTGGAGGTASTIRSLAGPGAFVTLGTAQTVSGNKTFTGTLDFSGATITNAATFGSDLTVTGNLTVNGTTTTVNSTVVSVDDKNIELGSVASPTNTTADGGGITLRGTTDKTITWVSSTGAWTFNQDVDLASGKAYFINGTSVLNATTLGSGVTGSSLTSVGTLTSGTLGAGFTTVDVARGGTGATTLTGIVKGNGTSAFTAAVDGTDYLSPNATIDCGTY